ncbi:Serine/threonine protein kinase [Luteibacter sp. UNC138MFCol5.1]|uniref:class III lanthionine synthetase LanKC n=1 Tax=Luteibacter sp. UNC138MFCol5.1 TaxID=1502774 RepID=UPI0008AE742F|nr:class III lanthionine synthetase LanKC [Luteibacter sp. UNC138MFCol5.1]SEO32444.1 Serine/threonine protein kinase [Luteibacter sp. UNC138MFCol5.1]
MERRTELLQYTAVDREFFEPFARRDVDTADFIEPVRRIVPGTWTFHRSGIWMQCTPPGACLPTQGWKIHISSVASTARIVLAIAAATLVASGTAFKFAADSRMHAAVNGKRWPRGGSGKFITVYPRGVEDFRRVIEDLHEALSGYAGPYVLSDRRYRDSRVLYYRYGGIAGEHRTLADGRREWLLRRPDGAMEPDERKPHFHLPEWLRDPFPRDDDAKGIRGAHLAGGRYRIRRALTFSSAGGVYLGDDLDEGRPIVIKEARPYVGGGETATATLRKEFRLLRRLAPLHVAPLPVAHFQDWEHSYLVQEYIEGDTLRSWLARRYPWLKTRAGRKDVLAYLDDVVRVFTRMAQAVERVHAAGVSLGDLSFHNCIVMRDGDIRLIDMEAAVEDGLDMPLDVRTPGFASPRPRREEPVDTRAEDAYAFGSNLLAAMMPMNAMLPLDRDAALRFTRTMCRDMGYPMVFVETIDALLSSDPARRPSPTAAMATLREAVEALHRDDGPLPARPATHPGGMDPAGELFAFIDAMASVARPDRFVPAGPEVFESHPWGVAHGAAGVLHAYMRGGRRAPEGLLSYVLAGARSKRDRGSSLMYGDAGIAWVLLDAGEREVALTLLRAPLDEAIRARAGLYDGMAGWGLARLKAWYETGDHDFLDAAIDVGETLLHDAGYDRGGDGTLHWDSSRPQPVGLGHGASGVALFLLHLHVAAGANARFLRAAREALAFDIAQRRANPDGDPSWPKQVDGVTLYPYLRHGTAGVAAVAARFHAVTGEQRYLDMTKEMQRDLMRRHAISPGMAEGLAGIGEVLLDLAMLFPDGEEAYVAAARQVAGGIEPFLVRRAQGLAVPGTELLRLSCDLATGNAGVAAFFDRLRRGASASFMLDEHLPMVHVHRQVHAAA